MNTVIVRALNQLLYVGALCTLCLQLHFIFRHKNPVTGRFEVDMLQL